MFCRNLRTRKAWSAVPSLLASRTSAWRETSLQTHDLALPLPPSIGPNQFFRILLVSAPDLALEQRAATDGRIERLAHLTGGQHVGIIFLVHEKDGGDGTSKFLELQNELLRSRIDMPLLPLATMAAFDDTLAIFHRQLLTPAPVLPSPLAVTALLPFCSAGGELPERVVHVLSDVCHSLRDVVEATSTEEGRARLRRWLDGVHPGMADIVCEFWGREYVCG